LTDTSREEPPRLSLFEEPAEITYRGRQLYVPRGVAVADLMRLHPGPDDGEVLAAVVNNRVVSLAAPILRSGTVEPVRYGTRYGARIYRRHLTMMLYEVFHSLFDGAQIQVGQAISEGYYFEAEGVEVTDEFVERLRCGMADLAAAREPFVFRRVPVEEARRLFARKGAAIKRQILDTWPSAHVGIMSLRGFDDFCLGPVAPHTGYFARFDLHRLDDDFVLQFPDPKRPELWRLDGPQPKLYQTHKQSRRWSRLLGVSHVGDLNAACIDGSINEVIKIAEGLHEKRIADIADAIRADRRRKLVFIAGPSSAGKTTFAKRLSIQLRVAGIQPVALSLDNYYVDRDQTPLDAQGNYDFEALAAIDIALFDEQLGRILKGEPLATPVYNFKTGKREPREGWIPIEPRDDQVLIIEGIHGLNPALTPSIPRAAKYSIYINALNPLSIDQHNRLHTSDVRLIRRIVRDRHYRGYSAAQTIRNWDSVRRGERKHIFPYQETADVIFDTSLIYEFSVIKTFAERYLLEVPRSDTAFAEAYRLRKFLSMFVTVMPGDVPQTSLIREFIGGSGFSY
jgi:uridine kinase